MGNGKNCNIEDMVFFIFIYLIFYYEDFLLFQGMEKLVDEGLVKFIGLLNFNESQIECVIKNCCIKFSNLQVCLII